MKIFTSVQIHELDKFTIENEPIKSIDLMERAARALTHAIASKWDNLTPVVVFAGPGNNGGDALAVARMLAEKDYTTCGSSISPVIYRPTVPPTGKGLPTARRCIR